MRLTRLSKAINDYGTLNRRYPPRAVFAADGTPLLSWRVLLLPFLGEEKLFAEFRLNEPWDSPHNRALLPRRPEVFDHPHRLDLPPTHTSYLSLIGPGAVIHDFPRASPGRGEGRHGTHGLTRRKRQGRRALDQALRHRRCGPSTRRRPIRRERMFG